MYKPIDGYYINLAGVSACSLKKDGKYQCISCGKLFVPPADFSLKVSYAGDYQFKEAFCPDCHK